ncbi:MAG: DUF1906 domain-containing protein [Firmicutes bacterium]|nr:DUF1906 domain-containing protein [Bacillota bacterium]
MPDDRDIRSIDPQPPHLLWGIDSAAHAHLPFFHCVLRQYGPPDFWGRYLLTRHGICDGLSPLEIRFLHQHGIKILAIDNAFGAHTHGRMAGILAGMHALEAAKRLKIPAGTAIFADIEITYHPDSSWMIAWAGMILQGGYRPGFYYNPRHSAFIQSFCAASHWMPALQNALLWSNQPQIGPKPRRQAPLWRPLQGACNQGYLAVWQHGINGRLCGSYAPIDTNWMDYRFLSALW